LVVMNLSRSLLLMTTLFLVHLDPLVETTKKVSWKFVVFLWFTAFKLDINKKPEYKVSETCTFIVASVRFGVRSILTKQTNLD
jgi:hypothetical protein